MKKRERDAVTAAVLLCVGVFVLLNIFCLEWSITAQLIVSLGVGLYLSREHGEGERGGQVEERKIDPSRTKKLILLLSVEFSLTLHSSFLCHCHSAINRPGKKRGNGEVGGVEGRVGVKGQNSHPLSQHSSMPR